MLTSLTSLVRKWRASRDGGRQLLELLSHVEWEAPLGTRNHWLIELVRWVRRGGLPDDELDNRITRPQHVRLRYLLRTLDQHPERKREVAQLLRDTLKDGDAISMLCDTGMPTRSGFWGALVERLQQSWIPPAPNTRSLSALVTLMFADTNRTRRRAEGDTRKSGRSEGNANGGTDKTIETGKHATRRGDDASWIETIPTELLSQLAELLRYGDNERAAGTEDFSVALLAAMHNLCYQIGSTGLSSAVRSRLASVRIQSLPFYRLGPAMQAVESAFEAEDSTAVPGSLSSAGVKVEGRASAGGSGAPALGEPLRGTRAASPRLLQEVNLLRALLDECHHAIRELYAHLDANGVSVEVVFQVERMRTRLLRFERLLDAWMMTDDPGAQASLFADLVRATRAKQSVGHLLTVNFSLLSRKMIESCAQTGDHYIARDRPEFRAMLWMAMGGGTVTVATVYLKFFVTGAHMQPMVEGFFAGLNYAWSFLLMHFLHLTLATKQPAMTAPAIAQCLEDAGTPEGLETFAADVIALIRTQAIAIMGNLVAVAPLCLLVQWTWWHLTGGQLISPAKAQQTLQSFSLLGATPLWAAGTGVLLWLSGLLAGWAENWFALHRIGDVLYYNRRLRFVFGINGAARIAAFWRKNFSGIVSNLSLGMMLGLVPSILTAFALPFEVRHVTLSTGSIAVAVGVLGPSALHHAAFWWAVAGTTAMAFLNVAVSFALAFQMALRSRTSLPVDKKEIYRSVGRRLLRHPLELIFPAATAPLAAQTSREGV